MSKMMVETWISDGTEDKKKLAARVITVVTVLLLIFAGSPLANINTNTASAQNNPYGSYGTIVVNTNNPAANFTLTGPATYLGSGTSWSQTDAPAGTYTITYGSVAGYSTPASDTKTIVNSGDTITFSGTYNPIGNITVTTNNDLATFTITGPSGTTYSGDGTSWSQSNVPLGDYTITYDSITGYDTPPSSSQTLANSGDTIIFTGTYNPSVGTIVVNTNNTAATFNIIGPTTYSGSGMSWSQADAPEGTYSIIFDPIPGYDTPLGDTQTLVSGGTITFSGTYTKTVYTVTLQASEDAYISEQNKNNIYGSAHNMSIRSYKTQQKGRNMRSLVKFDISSLPTGSTIISATFNINAKDIPTATRNYTLNKATAIWNESSVTWSNKPAVATIATSFANAPPLPGWMSWIVTPDVQAWINGNPNYGWQISDQSENSLTQYTTTFYTKEDSNADLWPELVVRYTIN
jgi:hypothetical protein